MLLQFQDITILGVCLSLISDPYIHEFLYCLVNFRNSLKNVDKIDVTSANLAPSQQSTTADEVLTGLPVPYPRVSVTCVSCHRLIQTNTNADCTRTGLGRRARAKPHMSALSARDYP